MCTVTWLRSGPDAGAPRGYDLFFNRDERRTRGPEVAPAPGTRDGVAFLAPRDTDFGGTWIAVNELGLTVCVLNGYHGGDADAGTLTSRGLLVLSLASAASTDEVAARITARDAAAYRSFVLAAVDPRGALVLEWDGRELRSDAGADRRVPLVSSAFEQAAVREQRTAAFRALPEHTPAALEDYHRGHAGGRGPFSPCMHRDEARTRSLTAIRVAPDTVALTHTPGPPCETAAAPALRLPRRTRQPAPR